MPYNHNPIVPTSEITGQASLPLSRIKRMIAADDELQTTTCSNTAAFAITIATQEFLEYLTEQTYRSVRAERKPRKNVQYKDVANAIARRDNLEFLTDVVPRTTTLKAHLARKNGNGVVAGRKGDRQVMENVSLPVSKLSNIDKIDVDAAATRDEGRENVADEENGERPVEDGGPSDARTVDEMDIDEAGSSEGNRDTT